MTSHDWISVREYQEKFLCKPKCTGNVVQSHPNIGRVRYKDFVLESHFRMIHILGHGQKNRKIPVFKWFLPVEHRSCNKVGY